MNQNSIGPAETFSVHLFFASGSTEKVGDELNVREAFSCYQDHMSRVGARTGLIKEIRIVDEGDSTVAQWIYGQGHVFPLPPNVTGPVDLTPIPEGRIAMRGFGDLNKTTGEVHNLTLTSFDLVNDDDQFIPPRS